MDKSHPFWVLLALASAMVFAAPVWAIDDAAAQMLARQNGCFKCHALKKKKSGPPYSEVALKYRSDPAAAAKLIDHITTGKSVKFADGHEEEHKIVKATDPQAIQNLVAWILAQ